MRHSETTSAITREILGAALPGKENGDDQALRIGNSKPKTEHYELVSDGAKFGIYFRGEVVIHGMELERARGTVEILNEVLDLRKAS